MYCYGAESCLDITQVPIKGDHDIAPTILCGGVERYVKLYLY